MRDVLRAPPRAIGWWIDSVKSAAEVGAQGAVLLFAGLMALAVLVGIPVGVLMWLF